MKTLFTLLISFLFFATDAQEPTLLWLQGIGGNGEEQVSSFVIPTEDGGYIVGIGGSSTPGTGNIDSFCTTGVTDDVYIKYSNVGVFEWSKCLAQRGIVFPLNSGYFIFGTLTDPTSGWAFLIGKEDSFGVAIWQRTYGNGADAILKDIIATDDGGYVMVGDVNYIDSDFTIHYGSNLNVDIGVIKVDSNGHKIWSKVIGGTYDESAFKVLPGPEEGFYVFGRTNSNDFNCTGLHGIVDSAADAYLVRLDKNGNILWHHDLGGSGDDGYYGWGIADGKGGVILATGSNSADGDIHHHIGNYDYWALEIDSNNNILWENNYGSAGSYEFPTSICKATDGSIWMTGESSLKGGEVDTSYGNGDAWIVHADSTGNFMNAKVLGSSGSDEGTMVYPLSNGNVITGGLYAGSNGDFNSLTYYGSSITFNAFLATFGPDAASVKPIQNTVAGFSIFPNPANDVLNIVISKAIHTDALVTIGDVMGNSIYSDTWPATTKELKIDVSNWARGVYFVQINTIDGTISDSKIVVQ